MIEPTCFGSNPQTQGDNSFQNESQIPAGEIQSKAHSEFLSLKEELISNEIEVISPEGYACDSPDAVFPNNWFSTMPEGQLVLYPMKAENRRGERQQDLLELLKQSYPKVHDFTHYEKEGKFLEGTGSLVIDHSHRVVYASISGRTHPELVKRWADEFMYIPVIFRSRDQEGKEVYHTNVMMSLAHDYAIVCLAAIESEQEREQVAGSIHFAGLELINISIEQMHAFCGNVLEVTDQNANSYLIMSDTAFSAFNSAQISQIKTYSTIIHADLSTIERFGGGSARCMLAELW